MEYVVKCSFHHEFMHDLISHHVVGPSSPPMDYAQLDEWEAQGGQWAAGAMAQPQHIQCWQCWTWCYDDDDDGWRDLEGWFYCALCWRNHWWWEQWIRQRAQLRGG